MSLAGKIAYDRMALVPSTKADSEQLASLGHKGYVFPLDEAFELNKLPFKITVAAMLDIARESCRIPSYEEAEQILKEHSSIVINDDTMRSVSNALGALIYANDTRLANEAWNNFCSGKLKFPEQKKDHILYLAVDGAMMPTRQRNDKGSTWKENKLGMAFSTDNFFYWKSKC
jgi:hypothetical protein